jgi:hypothetical protein
MTPQALKNLILKQTEDSAIRVAYNAGDSECAAALNERVIPAFIPWRHFVTSIVSHNLSGVLHSVVRHRVLPDGTSVSPSVYTLCAQIRDVIELEDAQLRTPIDATLDAGCEALAPFSGVTAAELKAKLVAGAGKFSIVEATFGLDVVVTPHDVSLARVA